MRVLYNPISIFKSIFRAVKSIFSPTKPRVPQVDTVAQDEAKAQEARNEAARKTRSDAARRKGGRATFLTAPRLGETFKDLQTKKTTLGVS